MTSASLLSKRTQVAFLCMRCLNTPCWSLLCMLVFILYKNASLTPLQITAIVALKPASSLLSPYWSQAIYQRPDKIVANLIGANLFRHLPFLLVPWMHHPWYLILSFGLYMMLSRATLPAWMELVKQNLPATKREEFVGYGTMIDFLGSAILSVAIGILLDRYQIWQWLFFIASGLGLLSTLFLVSISSCVPSSPLKVKRQYNLRMPYRLCKSLGICLQHLARKAHWGDLLRQAGMKVKERVLKPWWQVWQLISLHKNFARFQIGFMLGGGGLMIMQPALPQFFIDTLHLSFTEMGVALSLCKGVGVALSSPFWTRLFRRVNIFYLSALVTLFATLFPFVLLITPFHLFLLYLAYAFYGIMQGGSELSWHMSGLVFSQEQDSSTFSMTNVLTVGLRGSILPILGSLLLSVIHPLGVILLGALLCLCASAYFLLHARAMQESGSRG